jgi:hypothetical protein
VNYPNAKELIFIIGMTPGQYKLRKWKVITITYRKRLREESHVCRKSEFIFIHSFRSETQSSLFFCCDETKELITYLHTPSGMFATGIDSRAERREFFLIPKPDLGNEKEA